MDRGTWRATVHGVTKNQTQLSIHVIRIEIVISHLDPISWASRQSTGFQLATLTRKTGQTWCDSPAGGQEAGD